MSLHRLLVHGILLLATQILTVQSAGTNLSSLPPSTQDLDEQPAAWLEGAYNRGKQLNEELLERHGADDGEETDVPLPDHSTLQRGFAYRAEAAKVLPSTGELLRSLPDGPRIEATTWRTERLYWWPPPPALGWGDQGSAFFVATVSADERVFVLNAYLQTPAMWVLQPEWSLSQLMWYLWVVAFRFDDMGECANDDYARLTWFVFQDVREPETIRLVEWAIGQAGGGAAGPVRLDPADARSAEAFWAVLGSPVVSELMQMLIQHRQVLSKRVVTIWVERADEWERDPAGWWVTYIHNIAAKLEDIDPPQEFS